ncbi:PAX-interacting protein 1-like isoform X2 [Physella acuta]|nr:PAX-interacting protein 1-like isoform X2 [Physella acuta]
MVVTTRTTRKSSAQSSSKKKSRVLGPSRPPGMQKSSDSEDLSDEGQLTVKMESGMSPEYSIQEDDEDDDEEEDEDDEGDNQAGDIVGPMPSEMSQEGEDVVQAAQEFERRSKRMKEELTVKAEAEEGPSKREEWMTELPPEMGKNYGLQSRTFSKGGGSQDGNKDRSSWTDTPMIKKEKEGKGKKRKRDEDKAALARDEQMQQQVDDYNKSKRPESLMDMHTKKQKKKKNLAAATSTQADSTQSAAPATTTAPAPVAQPGVTNGQAPQQQQQQQQQQHMQQYFQLSDEIRESLDLLTEQKNNEFYSNEFNNGEYNEAKPLADLLMNPNVVSYSQEGVTFSQAQPALSSQMIAQAYSHAQQMSSTPAYSQVISSTNSYQQNIPAQLAGNMNVTLVASNQVQDNSANQNNQQQTQTIDVNGQQVQAQVATQGQMTTQQVQNYAEAYAAQVSAESAVVQQGGQVVTFSLAGGQNMIIASPHTQQAGQNYVIHSHGAHHGQNIVIAAPGQQTMSGNFIVKAEGDELGHNIVLTQQNLQQALGQNVVLTQDGQLTTGESVVLTTSDGQQRQIQTTRQIQPAPQAQQQHLLTQAGIPIQTSGGHMPQVSLVLPPVHSLFPQIQTSTANVTPQAFIQLCAKMDKMINMVKDSQAVLFELNKRVERIETHLFPHPVSVVANAANKNLKTKPKPIIPGSSTTTVMPNTTNTNAAVTKASLKAALSNYLTISDYTATDELKRSDSNSDLFIPVGTVSMVQGQAMMEAPSPSDTQETASSTVQELPSEQELMPVVLGNANVPTSDINVPIVDSQSGIAVTVYDEGNENQKFELGPGSSKEPNARFSNTSSNPKTVILDPRFWEILVEDFQKNMSSDQIISAMSSTRKPLVRSIGTSEISICSTVLKEAESACQGRRERLAKELVFRIFTLGEVYDRNVSGVFYINGKKMENKNKALDPAKMAAIHYLVMKYPPSVVDNPRLERLVWKNCVDRINDALRRIYNWIHKIVDVNNIIDKLPTDSIMMH